MTTPPATELARRPGLDPRTVYPNLEALGCRGFVRRVHLGHHPIVDLCRDCTL